MFLLWTFFVSYVLCLSCCHVCPLQPCDHLLGKGWPLGSLVCDDFLCYSYFPMCCPGSSLELDCIDCDFYLHLNYIYHEWASINIVYLCYPQSVDIQISMPAMSSTTTLISELTIIRVWLPVKEACIMWTNM